MLLAVMLCCAGVESADAQKNNFFNGKDLAGWKGNDGYWSVKDGAIVGHTDQDVGRSEFLWSDVEVEDFYLSVDIKLTPEKRNAGIQFRSKPINEYGQARGYQADVGGGNWGKLYHEHGRRKLDWNDRGLDVVKPGDWNRYEILAVGDRIWTALNGKLCVAIRDPKGERSGQIAFQIHSGLPQTAQYRNPTLIHNPPVELAAMNESQLDAELKAPEDAAPILGAEAPLPNTNFFNAPEPTANTEKMTAPFRYMHTSEGREGYELAGEETNTLRVYDFYKRQAKHHLMKDGDLDLLPAYTDLDGGEFGHWGNYSKNGHQDLRWNDMDYGSAVAATFTIDKKTKIGGMLSVLIEGGSTVTFNKETGSYHNAWKGRPYFHPHRWGVIHGVAVPEGVTAVELSPWFPAITKDNQAMTRYLGHYLHGKHVVTQYKIGESRFLDSVSAGAHGTFVRTLVAIDGGGVTLPFDLKAQRDWEFKTTGKLLVATRDGQAIVAAAKGFSKGEATLLEPSIEAGAWNAPATAEAFKFYVWKGKATQADAVMASIQSDQKIDPLQEWTQGGPANWPERFKEPVTYAKDDRAYVVDRIRVPFDNPWGSMMMFSGIDFDEAGHAYLPTLMGDVWKVSGLGEGMKEVTWKRFATGLNQPFGIRLIDGLPYVLTRGSIVCLKDSNADDEADYYEDYFNDFSYVASAHTRTFGFPMDKDRTFYFVNGASAYKKPWNKPVELLASGLRNAMGVGASRDGVFLVGPQEGVWTPSSAVLEIQKDDYYGMGPDLLSKNRGEDAAANISPAMAYLPRGIDNSTGGFEFPESDRFGPLSGKIIGLSYGYGSWYQILRNDNYPDYGRAQGAIVPLAGEFRAGVVRGAVNPSDGMFYVVGTDGWGNYALEDGSLERIRYTGKTFPTLENVHAYENGIELQFSTQLSGHAAAAAKNYFIQQWNYEYSPAYGSLEFSVRQPSLEGHDRVKVARAQILPDGKSVFLEIPDLLPALQTHIYADLRTDEGPLEVNTIATFVHLDKAKKGFAEPVPALKSRTAPLRVRSMKIDDDERVAGNTANTLEGRVRVGETLFKMFCTGCHGPQGEGIPNIAPTLHSDWVAGDREVLAKALLQGLSGEIKINGEPQQFEAPMPAFGAALGDDEIASILSYIRMNWSDAKTDVSREFVQEVRAGEKGKTGPYEAKALWEKSN